MSPLSREEYTMDSVVKFIVFTVLLISISLSFWWVGWKYGHGGMHVFFYSVPILPENIKLVQNWLSVLSQCTPRFYVNLDKNTHGWKYSFSWSETLLQIENPSSSFLVPLWKFIFDWLTAPKGSRIKSRSTASALLSVYACWLQTHRQKP